MLMRRATVSSSYCSHAVLERGHLFCRNSLLKCPPHSNIAKNMETHYFGVQDCLKSAMLITLKSSSTVLIMISSMFMSICNRFYARRTDSDKNILGILLFDAFVRGNPSPSNKEFYRKKLDAVRYTVKTRSLYLTWR